MSEQRDWPERYETLKCMQHMNSEEFKKLYQQEWPITDAGYRVFMGIDLASPDGDKSVRVTCRYDENGNQRIVSMRDVTDEDPRSAALESALQAWRMKE